MRGHSTAVRVETVHARAAFPKTPQDYGGVGEERDALAEVLWPPKGAATRGECFCELEAIDAIRVYPRVRGDPAPLVLLYELAYGCGALAVPNYREGRLQEREQFRGGGATVSHMPPPCSDASVANTRG